MFRARAWLVVMWHYCM